MSDLNWVYEKRATWDEDKERIIGGARDGVFPNEQTNFEVGDTLPSKWWRVEDNGTVVGYGWLDLTWGDAEVLLAVDPERREEGVGSFIMEKLKDEARDIGVNYIYNVVPEEHPERESLKEWLVERGFEESEEDRELLQANLSDSNPAS